MIPYIAPEEEHIFTTPEEIAYIIRPFIKEYVTKITDDSEIQDHLSLKLLHTAWDIIKTQPNERFGDFDVEFFGTLLEATEETLHDLSHDIHLNPTSLFFEDLLDITESLPEPFQTVIADSYGFRDGDARQPQEIMVIHHVSIELILHAYALFFASILTSQVRK